ncbi:MAG: acyltransferase, partial [Alphaproteobacteria bacterium]|nr:acyltransferase [Alphaproteobacteria bacterium]
MAQRPAEIKALSGARALPPLILVLYHFCEGHGYRHLFVFDALVAKGYLWVEFFFILSGFILTHVYGQPGKSGFHYPSFLRARLARLYPLHLFMLLAMLALVLLLRWLGAQGHYVSIYEQRYHPINTWQGFVASLFLVQAWNILPYLTWNGASWFVSIEFLLCLLMPLYRLLAEGGLWRGIAIVTAGAAALAFLAAASGHGLDLTFHNGIFRGMANFAIGTGLAMLYREALGGGADRLPESAFSALQFAAVAALLYAIYRTGWAHRPSDIFVALAMALLIFTLAFDRGLVARLMRTRPLLVLGSWSYAIYLGQTFWLQSIRYFEQRWYPNVDPAAIWWIEPFVLLAVCVVWGALLATFVEHPANAWLRGRMS